MLLLQDLNSGDLVHYIILKHFDMNSNFFMIFWVDGGHCHAVNYRL